MVKNAYCYSCNIAMKLEFSQQFLETCSNIKCHENLSKRSRVDPCRRTLMTKLVVAFRNFANAPKNITINALAYTIYLRSYVSNSQTNFCMPQQIFVLLKNV
jgi:hypothetical protein